MRHLFVFVPYLFSLPTHKITLVTSYGTHTCKVNIFILLNWYFPWSLLYSTLNKSHADKKSRRHRKMINLFFANTCEGKKVLLNMAFYNLVNVWFIYIIFLCLFLQLPQKPWQRLSKELLLCSCLHPENITSVQHLNQTNPRPLP